MEDGSGNITLGGASEKIKTINANTTTTTTISTTSNNNNNNNINKDFLLI